MKTRYREVRVPKVQRTKNGFFFKTETKRLRENVFENVTTLDLINLAENYKPEMSANVYERLYQIINELKEKEQNE